MTSVFFSAT